MYSHFTLHLELVSRGFVLTFLELSQFQCFFSFLYRLAFENVGASAKTDGAASYAIAFFNIITYLLLNSDYGIGCVYSPLGLVIFVAVERTCMFYKRSGPLISNSIRCGCLRTDQCNIACLRSCIQKCTGNIGRRHSARRHQIAPFDLRRASLPVAVAISYTLA